MTIDAAGPPVLTVVRSPACHYCSDAETALERLAGEHALRVRYVALDSAEGQELVRVHRPGMNPLVLLDGPRRESPSHQSALLDVFRVVEGDHVVLARRQQRAVPGPGREVLVSSLGLPQVSVLRHHPQPVDIPSEFIGGQQFGPQSLWIGLVQLRIEQIQVLERAGCGGHERSNWYLSART